MRSFVVIRANSGRQDFARTILIVLATPGSGGPCVRQLAILRRATGASGRSRDVATD